MSHITITPEYLQFNNLRPLTPLLLQSSSTSSIYTISPSTSPTPSLSTSITLTFNPPSPSSLVFLESLKIGTQTYTISTFPTLNLLKTLTLHSSLHLPTLKIIHLKRLLNTSNLYLPPDSSTTLTLNGYTLKCSALKNCSFIGASTLITIMYMPFKNDSSKLTKLEIKVLKRLTLKTSINNILIHGPPGTGKTYLVSKILKNLEIHLGSKIDYKEVNGCEELETQNCDDQVKIVNEWFIVKGVIFFDEVDSLFQYNDIIKQLVIKGIENFEGFVFLATNYVNKIPESFRNFKCSEELFLGPKGEEGRMDIFKGICNSEGIKINFGESDLKGSCVEMVGYVAGDIKSLITHSVTLNNIITLEGVRKSMKVIKASCFKSAFYVNKPSTTFDDIGGDAGGAKSETIQAVEWPILKKVR
ncbi:hypothetical protein TL16_g04221 [Triparma laevis f. inornata]|uniref:AAA+ ATPase domain-containing protein n=1 Tax=Triparma laevis f. inornata TaxID=1714386 RepID=A0A9W7E2E1_9STRA|nr:hypothetical protein TL16_g04221 [Triparma laevis f. inornata]